MPTLRSSTRNLTGESTAPSPASSKRKATEPGSPDKSPKKAKAKKSSTSFVGSEDVPPPPPPALSAVQPVALVPATLAFSFQEAQAHLIKADNRFEDVFSRQPCRPFEHLEQLHPFRALVTSILGQQISWLAARSINHRFIRLYDASIPESHADYDGKSAAAFFPTPDRVGNTEISTLRTAGLSTRKAEYVKDLAQRFADGRLSTEKLLSATDEELSEMLIAVRGIGPWTVDMFAIFSLRRPNILPVGDLGVQRGMLRWFLSLHDASFDITMTPSKSQPEETSVDTKERTDTNDSEDIGEEPKTPPPDIADAPSPDVSSIVPTSSPLATPVKGKKAKANERPALPPPFTPSIKRVLASGTQGRPSLPSGLTVAEMKSRLNGKKKIKGAFLTPDEMDHLTEPWKPYRSLGVYYMWALAEED